MKPCPSVLRGAMAKHGMTIKEMACVIGISANSMSAKINGKVDFNLTEVRKILEHFRNLGEKHTVETLFDLVV